MKKLLKYIIPISLAAVFLVTGLYRYISGRTHFNEDHINGNTIGNLYNNGLFCEINDRIYFSNPYDNNYLYSMDLDGEDLKLLKSDRASSINSDGRYIYYTRDNGSKTSDFSFLNINRNSLCRYDTSTDKMLVLDPAPSLDACLSGNYIYYIHYDKKTDVSSMYQVRIDGKELSQVDPVPNIPVSLDQYIFTIAPDSPHELYRYDTTTKERLKYISGDFYDPVFDEEYIYYISPADNFSLARMNIMTLEKTLLTQDRVDCFNLSADLIYYQKNGNSPALCSIKKDGSDVRELISGNFTNINVTSRYVYFSEYGQEDLMYRVGNSTNGTVETFEPFH